MKVRIAAALVIGAAGAMAYAITRANGPHDQRSFVRHPGDCAPSSAAEGNATQQTRAVKQYGQTSGGHRC